MGYFIRAVDFDGKRLPISGIVNGSFELYDYGWTEEYEGGGDVSYIELTENGVYTYQGDYMAKLAVDSAGSATLRQLMYFIDPSNLVYYNIYVYSVSGDAVLTVTTYDKDMGYLNSRVHDSVSEEWNNYNFTVNQPMYLEFEVSATSGSMIVYIDYVHEAPGGEE